MTIQEVIQRKGNMESELRQMIYERLGAFVTECSVNVSDVWVDVIDVSTRSERAFCVGAVRVKLDI